MRLPRWFVPLVALGMLGMPAVASAITIDATALTSPTFRILHMTGYIATGAVQNVPLGPGTYSFNDEANGAFDFEVDAGGNVTYVPSLETFLDGAGTGTLTVRGFDVTFDARALTTPTFRVPHVFNSYASTALIRGATMLPGGGYPFDDEASNQIVFDIDQDGNFQYPAGYEDFLDGAGTPDLVVRGFDITVDARALTSPTFRLDHITAYVGTGAVLSITGIPGASYDFREALSNNFLFTIDEDGRLAYSPAYENFLDGAGTSALVVRGFDFTIDARGLTPLAGTFNLVALLPSAGTVTVHGFTGIPGGYMFASAGDLFHFNADGDGLLRDLPPIFAGLPVTGNGTRLLAIGLNAPPNADGGGNLAIPSMSQPSTVIHGQASDPDGDALLYRWIEETEGGDLLVLGDTPVSGGAADLDLAALAALAIGNHTFRLEVRDTLSLATDRIVLTVENSPPVGAPGGSGTLQISPATAVHLTADISDYDGDLVSWQWRLAATDQLLVSGNVATAFGGGVAALPPQAIPTTSLGVGHHVINLVVDDGANPPVVSAIAVDIIDTESPSLAPVASQGILWPPNHQMVEITIQVNAADNSGAPALTVRVASSEPASFDGSGHTIPDFELLGVDNETGIIRLNLRAERSGRGPGRTYTVTITASDASGNVSTATVVIVAPHDKAR